MRGTFGVFFFFFGGLIWSFVSLEFCFVGVLFWYLEGCEVGCGVENKTERGGFPIRGLSVGASGDFEKTWGWKDKNDEDGGFQMTMMT